MLRPEDCIPGTLVECVDDKDYDGGPMPVIYGHVYTIRETKIDASGQMFVRVDDHPAGHTDVGRYGFDLDVFRLLPSSRLEVFRKMPAPAPKETV